MDDDSGELPAGCLAVPAVMGFLTFLSLLFGCAAAWELLVPAR